MTISVITAGALKGTCDLRRRFDMMAQPEQFNLNELKLLSDACHFLLVCLDRDAFYLYKDLQPLTDKVDRLIEEQQTK